MPKRRVGLRQKRVVFDEVDQHARIDQQRRFDDFRVRLNQKLQLVPQFGQQFVGGGRRGDGVANLPLDVDGLGERAKVETDDGPLEPAAGRRRDARGLGRIGAGREHSFREDFRVAGCHGVEAQRCAHRWRARIIVHPSTLQIRGRS